MLKKISLILGACTLPLWAENTDFANEVDVFVDAFADANDVVSVAPGLEWKKRWNENWTSVISHETDGVSAASRRLGDFDAASSASAPEPDGITGATTLEYRHSEQIQLQWSDHGRVAGGGFYTSHENDYVSYSPSLNLGWDFFDRNLTLGISHAEFFDRFEPKAPFAKYDPGGDKRVQATNFSIAQSLTPLTLILGVVSRSSSWGYLGHPYNPVTLADGSLWAEHVPDQKNTVAASSRLLQGYFWGDWMGSVQLDYRYYADDWGLIGHTVEFSLTQYLGESFKVRGRLRYYTQGGADFASKNYLGNERYRTADIRLFPFSSYLTGLKFSGAFPESWPKFLPQVWEFKTDWLWRNTKGDRTLYQLYGPQESYTQLETFALFGYRF